MMSLNGRSLSSEFGDDLPHSLGRVPQKQFFVFIEFLGIPIFYFRQTCSVGTYFDPLSESVEQIGAKVPKLRDIRGQSWGHDGASRLEPALVAILQPVITKILRLVENTWIYSLVPTESFYLIRLGR
jgi:hypothetical protein